MSESRGSLTTRSRLVSKALLAPAALPAAAISPAICVVSRSCLHHLKTPQEAKSILSTLLQIMNELHMSRARTPLSPSSLQPPPLVCVQNRDPAWSHPAPPSSYQQAPAAGAPALPTASPTPAGCLAACHPPEAQQRPDALVAEVGGADLGGAGGRHPTRLQHWLQQSLGHL